jgi:putative DNA primase/helicase
MPALKPRIVPKKQEFRPELAPPSSNPEVVDEWPDPQPLSQLPPVPEFRRSLLPVVIGDFVYDTAERMSIAPEQVAATALVALGGCAGRSVRIQPKAVDTGWRVVPNLYGALVLPSGGLKSPSMDAVTELIEPIDKEWQEEFDRAYAQWAAENGSRRKGKDDKGEDDRSEPPPVAKRLILNSATWEANHKILAENPKGCFLYRDELSGLFSEAGKLGHEGEREFYLITWNGNSSYRVDRITRPSVYAEAVCLSLFGGIQPKRLQSYLTGKGGVPLSDDGFAQRLQVLIWPDRQPHLYVDRPPDEKAKKTLAKIFRVLANLPVDPPMIFKFDERAQKHFEQWYCGLQDRVRGNDLPDVLRSHLQKYASLMPTLALLFEVAERAAASPTRNVTPDTLPDPDDLGLTVSYEHTLRAELFCEFLEAHARRFYASMSFEKFAATSLARRIQQNHELQSFTAAEIKEKEWSGLATKQQVASACKVLTERHWVREEERATTTKGGRPTVRYRVNPKALHMRIHDPNEEEDA